MDVSLWLDMPVESDKWGWKHVTVFGGFDRGSGTKRWTCNHCNIGYTGSYSRVRAHLLGFSGVGVKSCPCIDRSLREAFQNLEEERLARKRKRASGSERPRKHARNSRVDLTPTQKSMCKEDIDDIVARSFYADGLNINVINSPYFQEMTRAIAAFGPGYEFPSRERLCGSFLSKEKERVDKYVAMIRESWHHTGCTMLCIGDFAGSLGCFHVNIFVSSPRGLVFLKAVDIDDSNEADSVFTGVLSTVIVEVGHRNILQIISHLDHAYKFSESLLISKFPNIFWSPCTSNSIQKLMEEIAEIETLKPIVLCAKEIEQCVIAYQHLYPSALGQSLGGSSDPYSISLAPSYCTVQRILDLKEALREVVMSIEWRKWKLTVPEDISNVEIAVTGEEFWSRAHSFVQTCEPFVDSKAIFNIEKAFMGAVHDWRIRAVEAVRRMAIDNLMLIQLEELLERRWDDLFSPLHSAGYILNPRFYGKGQNRDKLVMRGWKAVIDRYECESSTRQTLREELSSYWRLKGPFGEEDAVDCRDKMDPVAWWENFGFEAPHLQTLAIKVLSQVSSIKVCQEIWQANNLTFHEAAKRFGMERIEDLLFVQNNLRLHIQRYVNLSLS